MRPRQTSHKPKKRHKNRILWLSTTMVVLFVLSIFGLKSSIPTALAMEQATRCGLEEHVHDDDCYIDNVIICQQKAHSHSSNCYLLLLEDNDINMLLTAVSQTEDKNLESLIAGVLGEAVRLNDMSAGEELMDISDSAVPLSSTAGVSDSAVMTASFSGTTYAGTEVSQLNNIIDTFALEPAMVLNEGMAVPVTMALDETEENNGIATAAVEPNTSGMYLNIYTYIDGESVCIWTGKYELYWNYYRAYNQNDLFASIQEALAKENVMVGNYSLRYANSDVGMPTSSNTSNTGTRDARITFGTWQNGYDPVYLYLFDVDGKDPLNFSTKVPEPETESITIDYDVNFSTSGYSYIKSVTDDAPALLGQDMVSVAEGKEVLVNDVTDRNVTIELSTGAARYGTVHFLGWKVGNTDTIIKPASVLSWYELKEYASDGTVELTGQWDYHMFRSVNFFMSYRQNADTDKDSWTPVIFNTYVGGVGLSDYAEPYNSPGDYNAKHCYIVNPIYGINYKDPRDMDKNNLVLYDRQIRELHGESSSGAWLAEFPTDQYIFNKLKNHAPQLYVDDEQVVENELNENHYTIRWIAFKASSEGDPATWHVDGILVKKPGAFEITKTFAGNQMLIDAAKNGFSIEATNGKITHTFNLDNAISSENGVYKWKVEDVKYNEEWTITESPPNVSDALSYHEWTVVDPYNTQNKSGTGKKVKISGVTYPVDVQIANLMQVNFNNIYYQKNSLMLKKEDEKTGQALRGAEFELWQNGSRMTFDYNATTGLYEYNQNGKGASSRLSSDTANGYVNISTTGFSYENGEVTVKEVKTPAGYGAIDDIVLGKGGNGVIGILSDSNDYARYNDGLLIIQNSSDPIDVTVKKEWKNYDTDKLPKLPVIVQLLANGDNALASELIGITGSASVTLDGTNSYMHTWYGLPVYANGEVINWSVREIQIGDEKCKTDYSFANWIPAVSKITNKDAANKDSILLTITNMPKTAAILMLTKTDWDGTTFLPGTEFTLKNMNNGVTTILTTDAEGKLTFYNLKYETPYELTETKAPDGYWELSEPVYFTIAGDGTIQITQGNDSGDVVVDGKYNLHVKNRSAMPMPETGGNGTLLFTGLGMLMLFGVFTYQKKNAKRKRRRGARRTSR